MAKDSSASGVDETTEVYPVTADRVIATFGIGCRMEPMRCPKSGATVAMTCGLYKNCFVVLSTQQGDGGDAATLTQMAQVTVGNGVFSVLHCVDADVLFVGLNSGGVSYVRNALEQCRRTRGPHEDAIAVTAVTRAHGATVWCMALVARGKWVISGSETREDKAALMYRSSRDPDTVVGDLPSSFSAQHGVISLLSDPKRSLLYVGTLTGNICVVKVDEEVPPPEWTVVSVEKAHTERVRTMCLTDQGLLVSGSYDQKVCLWEVASPASLTRVATLTNHSSDVLGVASARRILVTTGKDRSIVIHSLADSSYPVLQCISQAHTDWIRDVRFVGNVLWTCSDDNKFVAAWATYGPVWVQALPKDLVRLLLTWVRSPPFP